MGSRAGGAPGLRGSSTGAPHPLHAQGLDRPVGRAAHPCESHGALCGTVLADPRAAPPAARGPSGRRVARDPRAAGLDLEWASALLAWAVAAHSALLAVAGRREPAGRQCLVRAREVSPAPVQGPGQLRPSSSRASRSAAATGPSPGSPPAPTPRMLHARCPASGSSAVSTTRPPRNTAAPAQRGCGRASRMPSRSATAPPLRPQGRSRGAAQGPQRPAPHPAGDVAGRTGRLAEALRRATLHRTRPRGAAAGPWPQGPRRRRVGAAPLRARWRALAGEATVGIGVRQGGSCGPGTDRAPVGSGGVGAAWRIRSSTTRA